MVLIASYRSLDTKVFAVLAKFPKSQKCQNVRKIVYFIRGTCQNKSENIIWWILHCSIIWYKAHVHTWSRSEVTNFFALFRLSPKCAKNYVAKSVSVVQRKQAQYRNAAHRVQLKTFGSRCQLAQFKSYNSLS